VRIVISTIEQIDCTDFFSEHIGQSQSNQREIVRRFQERVLQDLKRELQSITWDLEYRPNRTNRDSIDIYGKGDDLAIAIELDKHRADQVAKKFVSRMAILPETRIQYFAICYPGTTRMNRSECVKYFIYCANLARRMCCDFAGLMIEK